MKILTSKQIHALDAYTIEHEPISSIDLMERAAGALAAAIMERYDTQWPVSVFAGPGNNGGDALAVARLLYERGYTVDTYLFNVKDSLSADCAANLVRLQECGCQVHEVRQEFEPPQLTEHSLVIDGLFGSGLNKPLSGGFAAVAKYLTVSPAQVVALDVPSGLMTEDNTYNVLANVVHADLTLTLGQTKLAMLLADSQPFTGEVRVLDIGLSREFLAGVDASYCVMERSEARALLRPRSAFAHKGTAGTAMLVAGSSGMAGAAILAARACLRGGVGKVVVHTPRACVLPLQVAVPEAVISVDRDDDCVVSPADLDRCTALAIGPGLGRNDATAIAMMSQLRQLRVPAVVDADALNILASRRAWLGQLPEGLVLTPHVGELNRLCDTAGASDFERLTRARDLAQRLRGYVVLKGHYTAVCMPDGQVSFNPTGNAGMATAGMGDVLTGVITALLAQGYPTADAVRLAVYLHGLAGDIAAHDTGQQALVASDVIRCLGQAFAALEA